MDASGMEVNTGYVGVDLGQTREQGDAMAAVAGEGLDDDGHTSPPGFPGA